MLVSVAKRKYVALSPENKIVAVLCNVITTDLTVGK
jgi:hypothetical protein